MSQRNHQRSIIESRAQIADAHELIVRVGLLRLEEHCLGIFSRKPSLKTKETKMLKSEWNDSSHELTADETSQVGGGGFYGPSTPSQVPFVPPSAAQQAADAAFFALVAKIVAFQGYTEYTSGPNAHLIIPAGLNGTKPPRGHRS